MAMKYMAKENAKKIMKINRTIADTPLLKKLETKKFRMRSPIGSAVNSLTTLKIAYSPIGATIFLMKKFMAQGMTASPTDEKKSFWTMLAVNGSPLPLEA